MKNQLTIEAKFNKMAEEVDGGDDAANARQARRQIAKGKIISYDEAKAGADSGDEKLAALLAKMEKYLSPLAHAPDDFNVVMNYGQDPIEKLGKVGMQMIDVQGKFEGEVNVMAGAIQQLKTGIDKLGIENMGEKTRAALEGLVDTSVKGVKGLGSFTKGLWDTVSGKKAKRTEDQKLVDDMQNSIPDLLKEMIKMVDSLDRTEKGIKKVRDAAVLLGEAQVEAAREINIYLGASSEGLRRYQDEYIPEANAAYEESGDPADEQYLTDVIKRQEHFIRRINTLTGARTNAVGGTVRLRLLIDTMDNQLIKIDEIMHTGKHEWAAMLASAGLAGAVLKASNGLKKADELGDRMHDETIAMMEAAQEMTLNSLSRGTVDVAKQIEGLSRLQTMLEKNTEHTANALRTLEANSKASIDAVDKLLDSVNKEKEDRVLEAVAKKDGGKPAPTVKKEAAKPVETAPAADLDEVQTPSNDDKPAATPKASSRPARKTGTNPKL